ncbi:hypothetical protein DL770_010050 [Monosporascus sp. CRB-9-2]|nr:hypothetical protein DL770_010050 [Monosporascus sp. CRB-9-2]
MPISIITLLLQAHFIVEVFLQLRRPRRPRAGASEHLEDDLGMAGNDFNVAVSVLVVGYILMQVPSNMLLTRFYPGALYLLAIFYIQVASRVVILYTANMGGLTFANLIAAGIFAGLDGKRGRSEALWSAVRDGRLWLFCAIQNFHYAGTSFINFLPTVIHDPHFTSTVALLLACPPYIFGCVAALPLAWSSGRFHERTWHNTAGFAAAIVGFAAAASMTASNTAGHYTACFVFPAGAFSVNSVISGWIATTLSQSREKKAARAPLIDSTVSVGFDRLLTSYVPARLRWLPPTSLPRSARYMGISLAEERWPAVPDRLLCLCGVLAAALLGHEAPAEATESAGSARHVRGRRRT